MRDLAKAAAERRDAVCMDGQKVGVVVRRATDRHEAGGYTTELT